MSDEIPNIHMLISPKDDQGKMVDECIELPLVVEGKSEEELEQKMHSIAEGFFEVFLERKQEVFNKVVTIPAKF